MTLKSLFNEVHALGFDSVAELDEAFVFAANRALSEIALTFAPRRLGIIPVSAPRATLVRELYVHGGEATEIPVCGRCFSFISSGTGRVTVRDDNGTRAIDFGGAAVAVRGVISGNAVLTFEGDEPYTVADLATFEAPWREEKIPLYSRACEYDLSSALPDLLYVSAAVCDAFGKPIDGASAVGSTLRLPREFCGKAYVEYRHRPRALSIDRQDEEVDIDGAISFLLPILTASYVWLDDDAEKATYYLGIYRREAELAEGKVRGTAEQGFTNVTGWA